jgi:hypothetical protein
MTAVLAVLAVPVAVISGAVLVRGVAEGSASCKTTVA